MRLSDQALATIMMALQKSLLEQSDITEILRGFEFVSNEVSENEAELTISNPPFIKYDNDSFFSDSREED